MIRTLVTIKKFDRNSRLVDSDVREFYSRSWTKHFMEGLYVQHGHILTASALVATDIMGDTGRTVDGDGYVAYHKSNMRVIAGGGSSSIILPTGDQHAAGFIAQSPIAWFAAHVIGIQIGRDNTAVAPLDNVLRDRVDHGIGASVAAAVVDQNLTHSQDLDYASTNGFLGFVYIPSRSCTITDIAFQNWRTGNPGNVTCQVHGLYSLVSANDPYLSAVAIGTSDVVNANLWGAASPGAVVHYNFSTPVKLQQGVPYYICITPSQAAAGNRIEWRTANAQLNPRIEALNFVNVNAVGQPVAGDVTPYFILTGTSGAQMEIGGTDLYSLTVADPNASFVMRRIFMNHSGEAINVQEAGIYFPLCNYKAIIGVGMIFNTFIFCAARDIFAGIAVANGESLEVTYTPSITV
jgi:hypothetical protein